MKDIVAWLDPDREAFWRLRLDGGVMALLAAAALGLFLIHEPARRFLFILDWFNIIVHEAGHPIFGLLGIEWIVYAGGTFMQLLMPTLFYFSFLRQGQPKSADVCLFWFGSNFLGIGPYMADARAQILPLIGGGEHDWTYLLGSIGLLRFDRQCGALALYFGCFTMALAALSLYEHAQKRSRST
jgi:hypothetical protein